MTSKWARMEESLGRAIEPMNHRLGDGQVTIGLLAGLSLARSWVTELQPGNQWEQFRARLRAALEALASAPDAGSATQFGVWDGVHFAACEAGRIDGEAPGA